MYVTKEKTDNEILADEIYEDMLSRNKYKKNS